MTFAIAYLVAVTALCVFTVAYARYEDNRDRETFARHSMACQRSLESPQAIP